MRHDGPATHRLAGEACGACHGLDAWTPAAFALAQNAPKPFNSSTEICFSLPEAGEAVLRVHDIAGREVATLVIPLLIL